MAVRTIHETSHCTEDDETALVVASNRTTDRVVLRIRSGTSEVSTVLTKNDAAALGMMLTEAAQRLEK